MLTADRPTIMNAVGWKWNGKVAVWGGEKNRFSTFECGWVADTLSFSLSSFFSVSLFRSFFESVSYLGSCRISLFILAFILCSLYAFLPQYASLHYCPVFKEPLSIMLPSMYRAISHFLSLSLHKSPKVAIYPSGNKEFHGRPLLTEFFCPSGKRFTNIAALFHGESETLFSISVKVCSMKLGSKSKSKCILSLSQFLFEPLQKQFLRGTAEKWHQTLVLVHSNLGRAVKNNFFFI